MQKAKSMLYLLTAWKRPQGSWRAHPDNIRPPPHLPACSLLAGVASSPLVEGRANEQQRGNNWPELVKDIRRMADMHAHVCSQPPNSVGPTHNRR